MFLRALNIWLIDEISERACPRSLALDQCAESSACSGCGTAAFFGSTSLLLRRVVSYIAFTFEARTHGFWLFWREKDVGKQRQKAR